MKRAIQLFTSLALLWAVVAFAQEETSDKGVVQVMQSDQYGAYLTDAEGRTLYLFVSLNAEEGQASEQMTEGVREEAASCSVECQGAWPPFTAGENENMQVDEGVVEDLLYTADVNGQTQVVYNGWPLYYFAQDEKPGDTNGQGIEGFGGEWYLVSPEGQPIEGEGEAAGSAETGD